MSLSLEHAAAWRTEQLEDNGDKLRTLAGEMLRSGCRGAFEEDFCL